VLGNERRGGGVRVGAREEAAVRKPADERIAPGVGFEPITPRGRDHVDEILPFHVGEGRVALAHAEAERLLCVRAYGQRQLEPFAERRIELRTRQQLRDRPPPPEDARLRPSRPEEIPRPSGAALEENETQRQQATPPTPYPHPH